MVHIDSASGNGKSAKVGSDLRLWTEAVTRFEEEQSIVDGDAYNINTGQISLSATGAVIYLKNNEDRDLFISSFALGS